MLLAYCEANPLISPLTTLVRVPEHDSAIIQSERVGGNFAYSTVEGHAYAALNPVFQNIHTPVAVNYRTHPLVAPVPVPVYAFP